MFTVILIALTGALAINLLLFPVAYKLQSDKLTDISYAISFLTVDVIGLLYAKEHNLFSWVLFLMVALWAARIGGFLLYRVLKVGKDRRFDGMRENFFRFGRFWLGQALTAWILMLPVVMAQYRGGTMVALAFAGLALWLAGLLIEAAADYQKFRFKTNPGRHPWIDTGLWKYARHPNYFGEVTVWAGLYVYCFHALVGAERLVALASPLFIAVLLLFISGVPILEKSANKRWGGQAGYKAYKRRTRLLLPLPKLLASRRETIR